MARTITGTVVSDKSQQTIVISVAERKTHPIYKKQYTVNTKFMAHDAKNDAKVGDRVTIEECRPLSARKRFTLLRILERGGVRFEESDAISDVPVEESALADKSKVTEAKPKAAAKAEGK